MDKAKKIEKARHSTEDQNGAVSKRGYGAKRIHFWIELQRETILHDNIYTNIYIDLYKYIFKINKFIFI